MSAAGSARLDRKEVHFVSDGEGRGHGHGGRRFLYREETAVVTHRVMVPPDIAVGQITHIAEGDFTVTEGICTLKVDGQDREVPMLQKWPVRQSRPVMEKLAPSEQLVTGQRVIDAFFPIAMGGSACVPGPFAGEDGIQNQWQWLMPTFIVYIGCGERGNEMNTFA